MLCSRILISAFVLGLGLSAPAAAQVGGTGVPSYNPGVPSYNPGLPSIRPGPDLRRPLPPGFHPPHPVVGPPASQTVIIRPPRRRAFDDPFFDRRF
jgi:hypothetical protein